MATVPLYPPFEQFLDEVVEKWTPEQILAMEANEQEQRRAEELLDKNNEGELTAEEKIELQQMLEFERLMSLLKAKAAYRLSQSS